jgi:hypothetical protein
MRWLAGLYCQNQVAAAQRRTHAQTRKAIVLLLRSLQDTYNRTVYHMVRSGANGPSPLCKTGSRNDRAPVASGLDAVMTLLTCTDLGHAACK